MIVPREAALWRLRYSICVFGEGDEIFEKVDALQLTGVDDAAEHVAMLTHLAYQRCSLQMLSSRMAISIGPNGFEVTGGVGVCFVAHLKGRGQFFAPMGKYRFQIFARMIDAGDAKHKHCTRKRMFF